MINSTEGASLFATPSFEPRSIEGPKAFLDAGGSVDSAFLAKCAGGGAKLDANVKCLRSKGFQNIQEVDRTVSRSLWEWTWESVKDASDDIVIDASCIPRELLGIILFAISLRRDSINRVRVIYTPPEKYITQRQDIPEDERWLSRGLRTVRSILGYPGHFIGDRERHVIAMTGHEVDRLAEIIGYLEPTKLSLNNEQNDSSTIPEAGEISESVKSKLRETIGRPKYNEIVFYANSIERTYYSLKDSLSDSAHENTIIIGMNTKLSFIGAALCALHLRHIRMVYAVPAEYNPEYSKGSGEVEEHDITKFIKGANTIQAHFVQEE